MRNRLIRFRRVAVAALTGVTVLGGVAVLGAGSASASIVGANLPSITVSPAPAGGTLIYPGTTNQAASNWTITLPTNAFAANDTITIEVADHGAAENCATSANEYVGFAATPSVAVTNNTVGGTETAPTITPAVSHNTNDGLGCSAINDILTLTFTNSASSGTTSWTITVSGVAYNVGTAAVGGAIHIIADTAATGVTTTTMTATGNGVPNATVSLFSVAGNSPSVALTTNQTLQSVSNIVYTDFTPTMVANDYVCIALTGTSGTNPVFSATSTPSVAASGGTAAVTSATPTGMGTNTLTFQVSNAGTAGTPAVYTLSNLAVDTTSTGGGPVTATAKYGPTVACANAGAAGRAFSVLASNRIQGSDADATAAAETEAAYTCLTINGSVNTSTTSKATIVLATDAAPWDALSASFLAGHLHTGILLTPTAAISPETLAALRLLGIANVIVAGGPLAVSPAAISQLQATPVYTCNGAQQLTGVGTTQMLSVTQVYGQTDLDTAADIAQYFGAGAVRSADLEGAYGEYNDTTGTASTSATTGATAVKTAILATDNSFADAVAASAAAYNDGTDNGSGTVNFPVVLTDGGTLSAQAIAALTNLGIQQVILMGGPLAIANAEVTTLQGMGIEVIRVAGQDYTDTSQELATLEFTNTITGVTGTAGLNWTAPAPAGAPFAHGLYVARGDFYSDGLAGGVLAGWQEVPLVLVLTPGTVGQYLTTFLNGLGAPTTTTPVYTVDVFGGSLAVAPATVTAILNAIAAG